MSTGSRPPKRPGVGSRNPTGRPRKVAGRRDAPAAGDASRAGDGDRGRASRRAAGRRPGQPVAGRPGGPESTRPTRTTPDEGPGSPRGGCSGAAGTTVALLVALVVLAGVLAAEIWYVAVRRRPARRPRPARW